MSRYFIFLNFAFHFHRSSDCKCTKCSLLKPEPDLIKSESCVNHPVQYICTNQRWALPKILPPSSVSTLFTALWYQSFFTPEQPKPKSPIARFPSSLHLGKSSSLPFHPQRWDSELHGGRFTNRSAHQVQSFIFPSSIQNLFSSDVDFCFTYATSWLSQSRFFTSPLL